MKKILYLILTIIIFSLNSAYSVQESLRGGIAFDRVINNAPELIRYTALGQKDKVEFLLKNGASPNQTFMKITPTFVAIYKDFPEILELLLKYGADPDYNYMKETLLGFAIYNDCYNCTEILIKYGADINLKSLNNLPINIALKMKNEEISKLLYISGSVTDKKTLKLMKKCNFKF